MRIVLRSTVLIHLSDGPRTQVTKIHSLCFCRVYVVIFSIQFSSVCWFFFFFFKYIHTQALRSIQKHNQGHMIIGQFKELVVKSVKGPSCTKSIVYHNKPFKKKALIHPKKSMELPLCTECYVRQSIHFSGEYELVPALAIVTVLCLRQVEVCTPVCSPLAVSLQVSPSQT